MDMHQNVEARFLASSSEYERIYELLDKIASNLDKLTEDQEATRAELENHMRGEAHLLDLLRDAFPGGDPKGHREWHQAEIERIRERRDFWRKMSFELAKWGLIAFLGWLFLQMWHGALQGPGK